MAQRSSTTLLIVALLLFAGAGLVGYLLLRGDDQPPPPPPPERPIEPAGGGLVTAPPPPLPDLPPPPPPEEPDAGPQKIVRKGSGGGRCNGTIDAAAVRRYAQQHSGSLRRCYERRLKQNNTLSGRLEIGLTVGSGGQVQGARITSDSVRDPEVAACVRQAVGSWRLPAPQGGCVNVAYPISFTPRAGD